MLIIMVYVDDILIASNNSKELEEIKLKLSSKFDMVDLKQVVTSLGIEIDYSEKLMTLSQRKFTEKLIKKFVMEGSFPIHTPIEKNLKLERNTKENNVNVPYRELIGSLLYLSTATRSDICYAVNFF